MSRKRMLIILTLQVSMFLTLKLACGQPPIEDDGYQAIVNGEKIHTCPTGSLMIGVDERNNRFLCSRLLTQPVLPIFVDISTHADYVYDGKSHSVHVCPGTSVMVGWSQAKNWLVCATLPPLEYTPEPAFGHVEVNGPGGTQVTEPNHPDRKMHSCDPQGAATPWVMKGIKAVDNVFICFNASMIPPNQ